MTKSMFGVSWRECQCVCVCVYVCVRVDLCLVWCVCECVLKVCMFLAIERFLRKIGNQPNYQLPTNYGIGLMGPGNYCRTSKKTARSIWTRVAPMPPTFGNTDF